jgi:hypothetical protein
MTTRMISPMAYRRYLLNLFPARTEKERSGGSVSNPCLIFIKNFIIFISQESGNLVCFLTSLYYRFYVPLGTIYW